MILTTADQSIQAGDGGWGFALDAQGFRRIKKIDSQLYFAGVYLFNPMGTNGVYTFRSFPQLNHREDYMSITDAVRRDRTRSVPDVLNGIHGDAAFADYTVILSVGHRF